MTRRGKWAQMKVVPLCVEEAKRAWWPPHACAGACVPQQQAGPGRQAVACGQVRQRCACWRAGGACMRYRARLGKVGGGYTRPEVRRLRFPAACRGSASSAWAGSRRGRPDGCHV
jgi:hypothetical protein